MTEPGRPARRTTRWGLGDVVLAVVAGLVVFSITASSWMSATGAVSTDLSTDIAGLVGEWAGVVAVLVLVSRSKGAGSLAADYGLRITFRADLLLGAAAGIASQAFLSYLVTPVVSHFQHHLKLSEHALDVGKRAASSSAGAKVAVVLVFVVGAPIIEELFFRGALQRALTRRVGVPVGIALCAAIFGLLHLQSGSAGSEVTLFGELAFFGVVLSLLAERTGRLGPGVVAHAAFNAVATYSILHH